MPRLLQCIYLICSLFKFYQYIAIFCVKCSIFAIKLDCSVHDKAVLSTHLYLRHYYTSIVLSRMLLLMSKITTVNICVNVHAQISVRRSRKHLRLLSLFYPKKPFVVPSFTVRLTIRPCTFRMYGHGTMRRNNSSLADINTTAQFVEAVMVPEWCIVVVCTPKVWFLVLIDVLPYFISVFDSSACSWLLWIQRRLNEALCE